MISVEYAIRLIKSYKNKLTRQQMRTLCGQAKAGNTDAAMKGLETILARGRSVNG